MERISYCLDLVICHPTEVESFKEAMVLVGLISSMAKKTQMVGRESGVEAVASALILGTLWSYCCGSLGEDGAATALLCKIH